MMEEIPFDGTCPQCKSDNLKYNELESSGNSSSQDISCNDCGKEFYIWSEIEWFVGELTDVMAPSIVAINKPKFCDSDGDAINEPEDN